MAKPLRIVAIEGPGDVIHTFRHWRAGIDDPAVTHVPFSHQFYDVAQALDARVLVLGEHPRIEHVDDGNFSIVHHGRASNGKDGAAYHLAELAETRMLLAKVARFKPDVVLTADRPYPFLMNGLRTLGIKLVCTLHCVLWPKFVGRRRSQLMLDQLNAAFYRSGCSAVLCVSEDVKRQVREITGGPTAPLVDFVPHFRAATFTGIADPLHGSKPFRVMFAGRVEREKGVFDLLEVARKLRVRGRDDVVFELCGTGSALPELQTQVEREGLGERFLLRGWCDRGAMRESFSRAHAVVVPTRTEFVEGFNMVVIEALLAKRPVITSAVCPSIEYVASNVVEVPPNDAAAYESAIISLADDAARYATLQSSAAATAAKFLDERTSYRSAIEYTLRAIAEGGPVAPREISPGG